MSFHERCFTKDSTRGPGTNWTANKKYCTPITFFERCTITFIKIDQLIKMLCTLIFFVPDSIFAAKIYVYIILEDTVTYLIGLIDFMTFNTIPNIDNPNNAF